MLLKLSILSLLAMLTGFQWALAQEGDGTLEEIRASFASESAAAAAPQLERYIKKLRDLEAKASEIRDYDLAIKIRDERMAAIADWRRNAGQESGETILAPGDAVLTGAVALNDSGGFLANWSNPAAKAIWALAPGMEAGAYALSIEYESPGGEVTVNLSGDVLSMTRALPATSGGKTSRHEVRALRLPEGATSLSFAVDGPGAAEFRLKGMTLMRMRPPSLDAPR